MFASLQYDSHRRRDRMPSRPRLVESPASARSQAVDHAAAAADHLAFRGRHSLSLQAVQHGIEANFSEVEPSVGGEPDRLPHVAPASGALDGFVEPA